MADATNTLVHLEGTLDTLEHLDSSTGLANRKRLVRDLDAKIASGKRFYVCAVRFGSYRQLAQTIDLAAAEAATNEIAERLRASLQTKARAMLRDHTISVAAVAGVFGVSRTTIYAYLPEARTRANAALAAEEA